jgi:hypothetical protein
MTNHPYTDSTVAHGDDRAYLAEVARKLEYNGVPKSSVLLIMDNTHTRFLDAWREGVAPSEIAFLVADERGWIR